MMRVSIIKDDPGHEAYANIVGRGDVVRVFLDEVEQSHVITADEEAGTVYRDVLDKDGDPQIDPSNPDEVWTETVTGKVRVAWELQA